MNLPIESDAENRVVEGESVSRYLWKSGELVELVEPDGTTFEYAYGEDGGLRWVRRNGGLLARYGYDREGRLVEIDRQDGPIVHCYDGQGRLVRTHRGDASPCFYRWEGGRVASACSEREETVFLHDEQGRLCGLDQSVDGRMLSLRFGFDGASRLESVIFPNWGQMVAYDWDEAGRPLGVGWNGRPVSRNGFDDSRSLTWTETTDGVREECLRGHRDGRLLGKVFRQGEKDVWRLDVERDQALRIVREGARSYRYDGLGRLASWGDGGQFWVFRQDRMDDPCWDAAEGPEMELDRAGRVRMVRQEGIERVFRYNDAGELVEVLIEGWTVARCVYDHKGRLVLKTGSTGAERYVYGPDDALLAIADGEGRPLRILLRLSTGIVGTVDLRADPIGDLRCPHFDGRGDLVLEGSSDGGLELGFGSDPYGVPLHKDSTVPYCYQGRSWHPDLRLYRVGGRWYDPWIRQYLSPGARTFGPDDGRIVNSLRASGDQRAARGAVMADWLLRPRLRNRRSWCGNDPINQCAAEPQ